MTDTIHARPQHDGTPSTRPPLEPDVANTALPWLPAATPERTDRGVRHALASLHRRFPRTVDVATFVAAFAAGVLAMLWATTSGSGGHRLTPAGIVLFVGLVVIAAGLELGPRISRRHHPRADRVMTPTSRVGPSAI